jgi:hypothetical protein
MAGITPEKVKEVEKLQNEARKSENLRPVLISPTKSVNIGKIRSNNARQKLREMGKES